MHLYFKPAFPLFRSSFGSFQTLMRLFFLFLLKSRRVYAIYFLPCPGYFSSKVNRTR